MTFAPVVLSLVTAQRLFELVLARRNTRSLLERGGVEVAPGHYPAIIVCHTLWLVCLWLFGWSSLLEFRWLAVFIVIEALRVWILVTLGPRWTTRIIVVPGETLVTRGPYRLIRHPNYAVVIAEIAVLPLALGLPLVALVFTLINGCVLFVRIRAENRALGSRLDASLA